MAPPEGDSMVRKRRRRKPDCCRFGPRETLLERFRRRVREDGPEERNREHGADGGSNCVGDCGFQSDWWCPCCSRWMCFCRGGDWGSLRGDDSWTFRMCDTCAWKLTKDEQRRLISVLRARFFQLSRAAFFRLVLDRNRPKFL